MKKGLLIFILLLLCSSVGLAADSSNLQFEVGSAFSTAIVHAPGLTLEEQQLTQILGLLVTARVSVLGNVSYPVNSLVSLGGEVEAGYMSFTVNDAEYVVLHLPIRGYAKFHLGSLGLSPYVGVNTMVNNVFSENVLSNTLECGVKLNLGKFFLQYGKEYDLQPRETEISYTRIGFGYLFRLF